MLEKARARGIIRETFIFRRVESGIQKNKSFSFHREEINIIGSDFSQWSQRSYKGKRSPKFVAVASGHDIRGKVNDKKAESNHRCK